MEASNDDSATRFINLPGRFPRLRYDTRTVYECLRNRWKMQTYHKLTFDSK